MVSACPTESDPRPRVEGFVSDRNVRSIAGLRDEGLDSLMDVVRQEVVRQDPDVQVITVDRDFLSDHGILFARELGSCLARMTSGRRSAVFVEGQVPVTNWQEAVTYISDDVHVYWGSLACRQVPVCVKIR